MVSDERANSDDDSSSLASQVSDLRKVLQDWVSESRSMLTQCTANITKEVALNSNGGSEAEKETGADGVEGSNNALEVISSQLTDWIEVQYPPKQQLLHVDLADAVDELRNSTEGKEMDLETICDQVDDLDVAVKDLYDQFENLNNRLQTIKRLHLERVAASEEASNKLSQTRNEDAPPAPFTTGAAEAAKASSRKTSPRHVPNSLSLDDLFAQVEQQNLKYEALEAMSTSAAPVARSPAISQAANAVGESINNLLDKNPNVRKAKEDVKTFFTAFGSKVKAATTDGLKQVRRAADGSKTQLATLTSQFQKSTQNNMPSTVQQSPTSSSGTDKSRIGSPGSRKRAPPPPPPPDAEESEPTTSNAKAAPVSYKDALCANVQSDNESDEELGDESHAPSSENLMELLKGNNNDHAVFRYLTWCKRRHDKIIAKYSQQELGTDATAVDAQDDNNGVTVPTTKSPDTPDVRITEEATSASVSDAERRKPEDADLHGDSTAATEATTAVSDTDGAHTNEAATSPPRVCAEKSELEVENALFENLFPSVLVQGVPIVAAVQNGRLEACRFIASQFYGKKRLHELSQTFAFDADTDNGEGCSTTVSLLHLAALLPSSKLAVLTWLVRAVWGGYADDSDLLAACGGVSPAFFAAAAGNLTSLKLLVNEHGSSVDCESRSSQGWTAAHFAAAGGHVGVLKWLHEQGCVRCAVDSKGENPLAIARAAKHKEAENFLRRKVYPEAVVDSAR